MTTGTCIQRSVSDRRRRVHHYEAGIGVRVRDAAAGNSRAADVFHAGLERRRGVRPTACRPGAGTRRHRRSAPCTGERCASPNLQFNSYAKYDNQSDSFGGNSRVRWTFSPLGDLFVVYNHNLRHDIDPETGLPYSGGIQTDPTRRLDRRWGFASNQLLVKVQYAFRY